MKKNKDKKRIDQDARHATLLPSPFTRQRVILLFALVAATCAYWPALNAGWFYDDSDYVISDPRLNRLELFLPSHWSSPPPSLHDPLKPDLVLPGYEKPLIADRYLWHLSFALERKLFGLNPVAAHTVNLLLHLGSILALYFALSILVKLYLDWPEKENEPPSPWHLLPALSALVFAVHPWASEPVCYVSARNGSMGTLFTLVGAGLCASAFQQTVSTRRRVVYLCIALFLAAAAYASKENFIVAPALWLLVLSPLMFTKLWAWSKPGTVAGVAGVIVAAGFCGWMGIQFSDRARGLMAQALDGHGSKYLFEIQSPLMLQTLADQLPCNRISLESNHPGWSTGACWIALIVNGILVLLGTLGAMRWPLLLGLGWFYFGVLPTNSFLPRPDFLAMRNFYLPTAGIAALLAGAGTLLWTKLGVLAVETPSPSPARFNLHKKVFIGVGAIGIFYWSASTFVWAKAFTNQERVWARSAAVAPDHSAVRLNHAVSMLKNNSKRLAEKDVQERVQAELNAALTAEDSPTMALHNPRPKSVRRALALRALGSLSAINRQMNEAEQYYRRSFAEQPLTQTWAAWADGCFAQNWQGKVAELVAIAEQRWPSDWWTAALRGLNKSANTSPETLPPNVLKDLAIAENAPDSTVPELRSLQARALFALGQTPSARPRLNTIVTRLKGFGVAEKDLARLERVIKK